MIINLDQEEALFLVEFFDKVLLDRDKITQRHEVSNARDNLSQLYHEYKEGSKVIKSIRDRIKNRI